MRSAVSALVLLIALGHPAAAQVASAPAPDLAGSASADPLLWPRSSSPAALTDPLTEVFVEDLLARLTVEEKVGQMIQADIGSITPEDLRIYPLGSILAGGNSSPGGNERAPAQAWVDLARSFRSANAARDGTTVPLIFGIDAVHGHNNVVGATVFPHNIGLGAARDPDLIRRIGEATAMEVAVTGADWTFGPTLAVPRDDRWGRAYEGYGEDPEIAQAYAGPMTLGLQGELAADRPIAAGHIAGSAKHFLADGGTASGKDQGDFIGTERELIDVHLSGYPQAINAGVLSIMVSFSSWNGVKHTGNASILRDVLYGPLGFTGFTVSDWNAHGQIPGCSNESCPAAINAGVDMLMAPDSWRPLYANTLAQVRSGEIPMARVDEAVRRILRAKVKAGLFRPERPVEGRLEVLGSPEHRALAREAVRKSLVLLKNDGVLPIRAGANVLVVGAAADDIGQASGGWTLTWQGTGNTNADFPNGQSIWSGVEAAVRAEGGTATLSLDGDYETRPDVAIVVFGETPYAEFQGDLSHVDFQPEQPLAMLQRLQARGIPTVSVFLSGRPLWVSPEINASNAFVAAWLPGGEGGGVADVLVGGADGRPRHDFSGRLGFSWPRDATGAPLNRGDAGYDPLFAYGYGLSYASPGSVGAVPEESGVTASVSSVADYLVDGRIVEPWSIALQDGGGQTRAGTEAAVASPRGLVTMAVVDDLAQESGRRFRFAGGEQQHAIIWGRAVDLSRQANGEMALSFRYRVDAAPTDRVTLAVGAEDPASQHGLDLTPILTGTAIGQWRTVKVRLSCFRDAGADLTSLERPFQLTTSGRMTLSVSEIRLASNEGDAICPSQ
ncbi:exo 1,3/1,4-beta-D-glucan glucohydrolase [Aquidulcibacter paucihalophilus]|nr:exo 1,3/1,4-beta-D-glucan glucohydrolase [Aquidulcibacter paucihalophilus]